jgi:hypothetical protein
VVPTARIVAPLSASPAAPEDRYCNALKAEPLTKEVRAIFCSVFAEPLIVLFERVWESELPTMAEEVP